MTYFSWSFLVFSTPSLPTPTPLYKTNFPQNGSGSPAAVLRVGFIPGALTTAMGWEKINQACWPDTSHYWRSGKNFGGIFYFSFPHMSKVKTKSKVKSFGACECTCVCIHTSIRTEREDAMSWHFYKTYSGLSWGSGDNGHAFLHGSNQLERNKDLTGFVVSTLPQSPPLPPVHLTLGLSLPYDLLLDNTCQAPVSIWIYYTYSKFSFKGKCLAIGPRIENPQTKK